MKATFARHGVPCEVVSDNGPQFSSGEFASFAKEWGFLHITWSPHYPKSNGLAESHVKVVKNLMKKAQDGHEDFHKNLMFYRSAPLQNGLSPAQLLMGQRLRTNLPVKEELLTPTGAHKIKDNREKGKPKQKPQHDSRAKELPVLRPGDQVCVWDHLASTWNEQGRVQKEVTPRSYQMQTEDGLSRVDKDPHDPGQSVDIYNLCSNESNQTQHTPESSPKQAGVVDNQQQVSPDKKSNSDVGGKEVTASTVDVFLWKKKKWLHFE